MDMEERIEKNSLNTWMRVLFAGNGALFVFVFTGITEAQSAVMLPQLKETDSPIKVTPDDETWIASLGILMSPVGAMFSGHFMDAFGRKKAVQLFFLSMTVGFSVIASAQNVWHLFIGRSICAFSVGFEVSAVIYLAEISTKRQRSVILALGSAIFSCGASVTYIIGGIFPWQISSTGFSLICLLICIFGFFIPESPEWLVKQDRTEEAVESFQKLGRSKEEIEKDINALKMMGKEISQKISIEVLLDPKVWKPFLIITLFHFLECATGAYVLLYYTLDFIKNLGTTYNELNISIALSFIKVINSCTVGIYFTSEIKRKNATAISGFLMGVGALGAGIYEFVYASVPEEERPLQWIPILGISLYILSSSMGVIILPWMMGGEVFPLKVRGVMGGSVFVAGTLMMFISIKSYLFCLSLLKIHGFLIAMAIPAFALCFFGIFILPETLNKSLQEIGEGFVLKKKRMAQEQ